MGFLKKNRILVLVILILLVLGFSKTASAGDIILNDLDGKAVDLSSYNGKPTILFFWTTWCPYCRKEIKILNQMYPQMKKEGITVFAVNIGEPDYKVQRFFMSNALTFGILLDRDGLVADKYKVIGVPTYVFMDKSGRVISDQHALPLDYKKLLFKGNNG
ncbi:MAG: TlpA disulfide reductase family protein [Candidatus Omnitrophica bacterium]|nr:TlpA disulfide reductase family protein [Candidatus Omnitrophota bacterium]